MGEKKSVVLQIVIAVAVIVIIAAIGFTFFAKNSGSSNEKKETKEGTPQSTGVEMGVVKDSIIRSTDSGQTFETYFKIATSAKAKIGPADVLSVAFHPETADTVVVTTYQDGIFVDTNRANAWKTINFPPKQIYSLIIDRAHPDDRMFASGVVSGNGRIFRTDDGGSSWRAVYAEPGNDTQVSAMTQDPRATDNILAGTSAGTVVRSTDGGDTWKNIGQTIKGYIGNFTNDSTRASFVYLLVQKGKIYHSSDGGVTWKNWEEEKEKEIKALNEKITVLSRARNTEGVKQVRAQIAALRERNKTEKEPANLLFIVADPNVSGTLYASATNGLFRSTDFGKYWKEVNIIESAKKYPIPSVAINPNNSDDIAFVAGKTFYRSINRGATWAITPIDNARDASFVAYDPFDSSIIFVGLSAK